MLIKNLAVIALPLYLAVRVRLPLIQKIALGSVFSIGVVIMVFAVVRVIVTEQHKNHPEISWLNLWSQIEASAAVIISSAAPFRAFFTQQRTKSYQSRSSSGWYSAPASSSMAPVRGNSGPLPPIRLEGRSYQHASRHGSVTRVTSSRDFDNQERMMNDRAVGFRAMV